MKHTTYILYTTTVQNTIVTSATNLLHFHLTHFVPTLASSTLITVKLNKIRNSANITYSNDLFLSNDHSSLLSLKSISNATAPRAVMQTFSHHPLSGPKIFSIFSLVNFVIFKNSSEKLQ